MKFFLRTFDVGQEFSNQEDFVNHLKFILRNTLDMRHDLVLLPEYMWLTLEKILFDQKASSVEETKKRYITLSEVIWNEILPELQIEFGCYKNQERLLVLGTAPFFDSKTQSISNRAVIINGKNVVFQDKLFLTPWESFLRPGNMLNVYEFQGVKFCVLTCFDIEISEISKLIRKNTIDLVLVPSATESLVGVDRVQRCASARSVENNCAVLTAHLVGQSRVEMISDQVGTASFYLPAQSALKNIVRENKLESHRRGFYSLSSEVDFSLIKKCKENTQETNPSKVKNKKISTSLEF